MQLDHIAVFGLDISIQTSPCLISIKYLYSSFLLSLSSSTSLSKRLLQQDWGLVGRIRISHIATVLHGFQLLMKMAMPMAEAFHSRRHVSVHGLYRQALTLQSILSLSEQLHIFS